VNQPSPVHLLHRRSSISFTGKQVVSPAFLDANLAGHLAHDHFDVLSSMVTPWSCRPFCTSCTPCELQFQDSSWAAFHSRLAAAQVVEIGTPAQLVGVVGPSVSMLTQPSPWLPSVDHHVAPEQHR